MLADLKQLWALVPILIAVTGRVLAPKPYACEMSETCLLLMKQAMDEMGLSARAYDKVRRVARTIADLEGASQINESHVAEAIQYRLLDRKF